MNKEKFIEEQCIPLSRPELYDEIFNREQDKENLIKYIEDKIEECEDKINKLNIRNVYTHFDIAEMYRNKIKIYQDILERIKNNNYEL